MGSMCSTRHGSHSSTNRLRHSHCFSPVTVICCCSSSPMEDYSKGLEKSKVHCYEVCNRIQKPKQKSSFIVSSEATSSSSEEGVPLDSNETACIDTLVEGGLRTVDASNSGNNLTQCVTIDHRSKFHDGRENSGTSSIGISFKKEKSSEKHEGTSSGASNEASVDSHGGGVSATNSDFSIQIMDLPVNFNHHEDKSVSEPVSDNVLPNNANRGNCDARRNIRRHIPSPTNLFLAFDSGEVRSRGRSHLNDSHDLSFYESRRRHSRSEIMTGNHCDIEQGDRRTLGPSTRASISRLVMLAENLFEVFDDIHRRPTLPFPAPESVVNSFPLKDHSKADDNNVEHCYICLAEYEEGNKIRVLPCHHEYHMSCVDRWLKDIHGVCPLCRGDVRPPAAAAANRASCL